MAYPRKPTMGSELDDPMRRTRPASPMASASPALPAYRTEGGFKQTPTPVNPAPRTPIGATPAPTNPAFRTTPGGNRAVSRPSLSSVMPQMGKIGRVGGAMGALGVASEAVNVIQAGKEGGIGAARGEAIGGAGRLGAMAAGANYGARIPGPPIVKTAGSLAGGALGYYGGEQALNAAGSRVPQPVKTVFNAGDELDQLLGPAAALGPRAGIMLAQGVPVQQIPGRIAAGIQERMRPKSPRPDFSNVVTQVATTESSTGTPAGAAPAAGAPGAPGGGADPNRVLGTFNGRQITQAQADELAGKLPTANSMPAVAGGNYVASTGVRRPTADGVREPGRVARPVAQVNAPATDNYYTRQAEEQRRKVMSDIDSQLFALRGRGMTYRSGRDAAAQLLATQAGLVNAGANNAAGAAGDERNTRANIALQNAQAQNAQALKDAELEGAQQIARGNNTTQLAAQVLEGRRARRPGVITTSDGQTGSVDDRGTFRPVLDAAGKPVRVGTERQSGVTPDKVFEAYASQLATVQQAAAGDEEKLKAGMEQLNMTPVGQMYLRMQAQTIGEPPVEGAFIGKNGRWAVENADGSFSQEKR